jgi:hypothetical protein
MIRISVSDERDLSNFIKLCGEQAEHLIFTLDGHDISDFHVQSLDFYESSVDCIITSKIPTILVFTNIPTHCPELAFKFCLRVFAANSSYFGNPQSKFHPFFTESDIECPKLTSFLSSIIVSKRIQRENLKKQELEFSEKSMKFNEKIDRINAFLKLACIAAQLIAVNFVLLGEKSASVKHLEYLGKFLLLTGSAVVFLRSLLFLLKRNIALSENIIDQNSKETCK